MDARPRRRPGRSTEAGENPRAKLGREHEYELGRERLVGCKGGNDVHVGNSATVSLPRRTARSASAVESHRSRTRSPGPPKRVVSWRAILVKVAGPARVV